jgi:lipopolysaccharide transport system ATP-binding protein
MSDIAIHVEKLSKSYQITHNAQRKYRTLQEDVVEFLKRPLSAASRASRRETFWALKDISFDVKYGEVLGIIGRNGAGKSTLLKVLSRITKPTSGYADIYGRVGSLLEVGTGFHPELTGRENIFLNGAVLGMSRRVIQNHFDEIVAFAEIEQFLDTPVKRYSSGMYMRLAFAVAAHLEPEVLVVDEVLAVGDAEFQRKCIGKMGDVARSGRTVLFVSHNMAAVKSLCTRGLLLAHGQIASQGLIEAVVDEYIGSGSATNSEADWAEASSVATNAPAMLRAARVLNHDNLPSSQLPIHKPFDVEIEYEVLRSGSILNISLSIFDINGTYVFASPSNTDEQWYLKPHPKGVYISRCQIPPNLFNSGIFSVSVLLVEAGSFVIAQKDHAISIEMVDTGETRKGYFGFWGGVVRPMLQWNTTNMTAVEEAL